MDEYLRLENICKSYETKKAVDDLSLSVPQGCIYGIIGPNGAGKTTTIRMIMNIIVPDSGNIFIKGAGVTKDFRNRVGYLPEERGLYKKMTLEEIIKFLAEIKGFPVRKIVESMDSWLEKMSLLDYKGKKVEELSKGMQQKLQFITTLIHQPELIILDELFSGLDPLNIELIKNILLEEKRRGTTILFSTHVMEQAEKLCDYICMINNGRKVLDGRLAEVKSKFGTNSIQINMEGDAGFIREFSGVKKVTEFPNYIELKLSSDADSRAILKEVADRMTIRRFEIMEPSLYDIFINVAGVKPAELDREGKADV
ncbi:MAG TPA: ATP-binding cassette domain-containing protein [candidate division Zixibacteria bacterium]|nr:ATP-binding cassette domain-containing protein [candidate division Zixibacteria bacterium]